MKIIAAEITSAMFPSQKRGGSGGIGNCVIVPLNIKNPAWAFANPVGTADSV